MAVLRMNKKLRIGCILMLALWLGACAGENSGSDTGTLALSITDAPVDGAEQVIVEFTGVEIQSSTGGRTNITYASPKTIDLLALQGGLRESLLERLVLDVGQYSWIRLKVNAEADGVMDSYIRINGADYELHVPSGSQTGLKLISTFNVVDDEVSDFTIDFDLRKSVHQPNGQTGPAGDSVYLLRPTLRLVETGATGTISGTVDPQLFIITEQVCSAQEAGYAVYLYEGDVTPDDIDGIDPDPVSTAMVTAGTGYVYTLAFIEAGDYTIAATCVADLDAPGTNDVAVTFVGTAAVSVTAGATTNHNFSP